MRDSANAGRDSLLNQISPTLPASRLMGVCNRQKGAGPLAHVIIIRRELGRLFASRQEILEEGSIK